jgi:3-oxoacyl-[acyl-carrier protein] reductase
MDTANSRPVIVSGGSRGLGLVMARHCLAKGSPVATFARSATPEMDQLAAQHPGRFHFETLDAADAAALEQYVGRVAAKFGSIFGLINNAAIGQDHLLAHISPAEIDALLTVNLKAPILLTRAVLRRMMINPAGGRIINITSICGSRGYAALTVYSATKGGMDAFTRSLAREVGSRNILVNAIAPGFFPSAMSSVLAQRQLDTIRRRTPTERLCTETDVLPVLDILLFSDANITGQTWFVDGGSSS